MSTETTEIPRQELMASPVREAAQIERQRAMAETTFGNGISPFSNGDAFKLACAMAERIAMSTFIPKDYQGNPENVLVAMDYASRLGTGLMMVMQNMDVVHGRPGLRGAYIAGLINASPLFSRLKYEWRGTDNPGGEPSLDFGCRAYATEVATGEVIVGTWIDWRMVKAEKWNNNAKWTSMREQMFQYRAAAFWSRANASDITLGLYESEEIRDATINGEYVRVESTGSSAARLARTVDEAIERREAEAEQADTPASEPKPDDKPRGRRVARRTRDAEPAQDAGGDATEKADAPADTGSDEKPPFDLGDAPEADPPADAGEPEPPTTTTRPALTLE